MREKLSYANEHFSSVHLKFGTLFHIVTVIIHSVPESQLKKFSKPISLKKVQAVKFSYHNARFWCEMNVTMLRLLSLLVDCAVFRAGSDVQFEIEAF